VSLIFDTGAIIRLVEHKRRDVIELLRANEGQFGYALVTLGELHRGVSAARDETAHGIRGETLRVALRRGNLLMPTQQTALRWGTLAAITPRRVVHNDLWIAATALEHALTLVTADIDLAGVAEQQNLPVRLIAA
jgi:predicted nucleic acid-binding protein